MCEIVDNYAKETAKEKEMAVFKKLFEKGVDFDVALHSIESISEEELRKIYEEVKENSV